MAENARDTKSAKPVAEWTKEDVADWARNVLGFEQGDLDVLMKARVNGKSLLAYKSITDVFSDFEEETKNGLISRSSLRTLWVEIEPFAKPSKKRKHSEAASADSDEEPRKNKRQKINRSGPAGNLTVSQKKAWVGRKTDLDRMEQVFAENQGILGFRPTTIAIGGPCGIGKTRLALQFIEKLEFDLQVLVDVPPLCSNVNELLKPYLGFNEDNLSANLTAFVQEAVTSKKDPNIRLKLVIYLDEIQNLEFNELLKLRHAVRLCANMKEDITVQLIISGTHVAFLRASFDETEWTNLNASTGGITLINLQPLCLSDASKLLEDVMTKMYHKANAKEILAMPFVEESLRWLDGNPRLIEFLAASLASADLNRCNAKQLLKEVKKKYWALYSERQGNSEDYYKTITSVCLAQVKLMLGRALTGGNHATTVKQLIFQGSAVWVQSSSKGLGTQQTEGYLSLPLAVIRWYITKKSIKNMFSLRLFCPDFQWRWEDFEEFTAELVALRLRAYWMCGYKTVSLKNLFEGLSMPHNIEQQEVPLGPFAVRKLLSACKSGSEVTSALTVQHICPLEQKIEEVEDPEDKEDAKVSLQKAKAEMNFLVVRNAPMASSWDVAVYVDNTIVLAIQTKHTQRIGESDTNTNVSRAVIIEERSKVPATIPLLFITNRPIAEAKTLEKTRRLILVHEENFSTMLGAFGKLWRFT